MNLVRFSILISSYLVTRLSRVVLCPSLLRKTYEWISSVAKFNFNSCFLFVTTETNGNASSHQIKTELPLLLGKHAILIKFSILYPASENIQA